MKAYRSLPLILLFLQVGVFYSIGQGIRVASAYYGSPNGTSVDVTSRVQQFADYGEPFRVGKETLRIDPASTRRKTLVVCQRCHEDIHRERPQHRKKRV